MTSDAGTETWVPPAPQVDGTVTLELFVDGTCREVETQVASDATAAPTTTPTTANPDFENPYGDRVRLALIGGKMLEAVYMYMLFRQQPRLTADEMEAQFTKLPELVEKWAECDKLREEMRHAVGMDVRDLRGTRYVMDAFVGTVFVGGGFAAVMDLVAGLVDPTAP